MKKYFFSICFSLLLIPLAAAAADFSYIGWLPYWKKEVAVTSAQKHLGKFTEFSPFAYSVRGDGTLADTMKIHNAPWPALLGAARGQKIVITPSIMWGEKKEIYNLLSNKKKRTAHINSIVSTVIAEKYDGIDIDYESKSGETKPYFSIFIKELAQRLHREKKILSCTIEARTLDRPQIKSDRIFGGPWANDYAVLGKYCDQVRLMAYDQAFPYELPELAKYQPANPKIPYTPVADKKWVEDVIKYTIGKIPRTKVILGIATYGREFEVSGRPGNWRYTRIKSLTYDSARNLAAVGVSLPRRSAWGEVIREYYVGGRRRVVVYQDRQAVQDKINIAKKYKIGGVAIFKIDGTEEDLLY